MEMAIPSSVNKIKILLLILLPVFMWQVDYHASGEAFTICLIKHISGSSCYGCGTVRGISAFLHFNFNSMYRLNRLNLIMVPMFGFLYVKEWNCLIGKLRMGTDD
jgi:hypothetical protein